MQYVMLARNSWQKGDYAQETFEKLMLAARFPKDGNMLILQIDCEFKDISVDGMGTVTYPKESRCDRIEIDLADYAKGITDMEKSYDDYMGIKEDFWYRHLEDKIPDVD